jgi:two-component system sensor histidine kinase/response regulator
LIYSDELLALIGIDKSRFGGTPEAVAEFTHPDDIERVWEKHFRALAEGDRLECDFRVRRPNGEVRWMHSRGNIVRRGDGTAVEAYGVMLDITER